jgi:NAD(P)H-flavin reductase
MSLETTFHRLRVSEVRRETADSVSIAFETPKPLADAYRFLPGQHLAVRAVLDGEEVRRNYSVCVSPLDDELRVAVKRLPGGRFSTWANEVLQPGDEIEVMAPTGHFHLGLRTGGARGAIWASPPGRALRRSCRCSRPPCGWSRGAISPCSTATATPARSCSWRSWRR